MSKQKRLFVVSDIHGHYSILKEVLDGAGFDDSNEDHIFVCCGDLFDRGRENRKVYDFIKNLKHKVLIRGNHDERLAEILTEKQANVYDIRNGTDVTIEEFFGIGSIGEYGEIRLPEEGMPMADQLCALVDEMVDYFETEHYVFVHGWRPTVVGAYPPQLIDDWRHADARAWHSARFSEWMSLCKTSAKPEGKTVVCGHRPTRLGYTVDPSRSPTDSSIFYGDRMLAIDAGTIRSGRMNILVLEESV